VGTVLTPGRRDFSFEPETDRREASVEAAEGARWRANATPGPCYPGGAIVHKRSVLVALTAVGLVAGMVGAGVGGDPTGACCQSDGTCANDVTEADCQGVAWHEDQFCFFVQCPAVADIGACCLADGICANSTTEGCDALGGTFAGGATNCEFAAICDGCITTSVTCPPDLNGNHQVDFADILVIVGKWGACPACCPEDLSDNEQVDFADILVVLGAWGSCSQ